MNDVQEKLFSQGEKINQFRNSLKHIQNWTNGLALEKERLVKSH
jgi:hypothetical protein